MSRFSLVIPVYRNEGSIPALLAAIAGLQHDLNEHLEVVFVVDGSPDQSHERLASLLSSQPFASQLISLSRNFGSFAAIRTGLLHASGPFFAVMAADLQEPIALVREFFQTLSADECDITLGVRTQRHDPASSSFLANNFWRIYRRFVQPQMPEGGVDVFGCNLKVRDLFVELRESNSSLVGLLIWVGFRRKLIPYERLARAEGKSAWTLRKKIIYMLDSIYAFTALPIVALIAVGFIGISFSVLFGIVAIIARLTGAIQVQGYTALVILLLFCTSLILFALGVVGGYVWRTFENTKFRPTFIIQSTASFTGTADPIASEKSK